MNTILNMGITYLKVTLFFVLLLITVNSCAQSQRKIVDTVQIVYYAELKKHLYPPVDSLTTKELALFTVIPEVDPNSSMRLIEKNGKSYIEVRYLEKNVWVEVLTSFVNHSYTPMNLKVNLHSTCVNKKFANKMLAAFNKVIVWSKNNIKSKEKEIYDGTSYEFVINNNGILSQVKIRSDLDLNDFRCQGVAAANLQIIKDLKNNSFNESNYKVYNEP